MPFHVMMDGAEWDRAACRRYLAMLAPLVQVITAPRQSKA